MNHLALLGRTCRGVACPVPSKVWTKMHQDWQSVCALGSLNIRKRIAALQAAVVHAVVTG